MSDKKETEIKIKARLVRASLEAARVLHTLQTEMYKEGDDLNSLAYTLGNSAADIVKCALLVPGLRVAVFPIEASKGGEE